MLNARILYFQNNVNQIPKIITLRKKCVKERETDYGMIPLNDTVA